MLEDMHDTPNHIIAGTTLRDPNLKYDGSMALHTGQNYNNVMANRQIFVQQHQIDLSQLVFADQTHSANIKLITAAGSGTTSLDDAIANTDALYSFESDIMLTSLTADCVPVLFWSIKDRLIGAIHSGWRGTVQEITTKTFEHIKKYHPKVDFNQIYVQLGPCISQIHFEVDHDVADQFQQLGYATEWFLHHQESGKYHIDNQAVVAEQCRRSGIDPVKIQMDPMCTFAEPEGFSHRENKTAGRHTSFIMQTNN